MDFTIADGFDFEKVQEVNCAPNWTVMRKFPQHALSSVPRLIFR